MPCLPSFPGLRERKLWSGKDEPYFPSASIRYQSHRGREYTPPPTRMEREREIEREIERERGEAEKVLSPRLPPPFLKGNKGNFERNLAQNPNLLSQQLQPPDVRHPP